MNKIAFIYTEPYGRITVALETESEELHALVQDFKDFLLHVGHHPENVERVVFFEKEDRQALPMQLDMFKDAP